MILMNLAKNHVRQTQHREALSLLPKRISWLYTNTHNLEHFGLIVIFALAFISALYAQIQKTHVSKNFSPLVTESIRSLAAQSFPSYSETRDNELILQNYPAYLEFVISVGSELGGKYATRAKNLKRAYVITRRYHPEQTARFLKGLRFELLQYLQVKGYQPTNVSTRTKSMRHLVKNYLLTWTYELNEARLRGKSIALRNKEQTSQE